MQGNPYYDYLTVRDPNMFFGREELLRAIFGSCERRQSFSLVGTRRIGKSSILSHMQSPALQKRLGVDLKRHIFIYIDMRDYLQHTLDDFFYELYRQIMAHAPADVELKVSGNKGQELFKQSLKDLYQFDYHPVLLMDVFDKVADERQFGPHFFSFLRAPATRGWISYVTASIKPLYQISPPGEEASPFFNGFKAGYVGALTEEEALQLIQVPSGKAGITFSNDDVKWIREQAGRHPFFLQVTCQYLFEERRKQKEEGLVINYQQTHQAIYQELAPHFDSIWKELSPEQQRDLKQEVRQPGRVERKLEELSESSLFRRHVQEKFQVGPPGLTAKDVRDALDKLDDRAFLQTCPLAGLRYVEARDDSEKAGANKRGLLVQELLRAAFERMKPAGMRSDTAPEWRLYNILYYHYFKGLAPTNEQIAARLGISRRQFYRDQDQAIQALIQELLDLDAEAVNV